MHEGTGWAGSGLGGQDPGSSWSSLAHASTRLTGLFLLQGESRGPQKWAEAENSW